MDESKKKRIKRLMGPVGRFPVITADERNDQTYEETKPSLQTCSFAAKGKDTNETENEENERRHGDSNPQDADKGLTVSQK